MTDQEQTDHKISALAAALCMVILRLKQLETNEFYKNALNELMDSLSEELIIKE